MYFLQHRLKNLQSFTTVAGLTVLNTTLFISCNLLHTQCDQLRDRESLRNDSSVSKLISFDQVINMY